MRFLKFFKTRSLFTKLLCISTFIVFLYLIIIFIPIFTNDYSFSATVLKILIPSGFENIGSFLNEMFTVYILFLFLLSLTYFLVGLFSLIYEKRKKLKSTKTWSSKSMIIKGLVTILVSLLFFFLLRSAIDFFSLSLEPSPPPQIPTN